MPEDSEHKYTRWEVNVIESLAEISQTLRGISARLDKLNGTVTTHDVQLAELRNYKTLILEPAVGRVVKLDRAYLRATGLGGGIAALVSALISAGFRWWK